MPTKSPRTKEKTRPKTAAPQAEEELLEKDASPVVPPAGKIRSSAFNEEELLADAPVDSPATDEENEAAELAEDEESMDDTELNPFGDKWEE